MKKKFVFAKPGKKRFVSQCISKPAGTGLVSLQSKLTQLKKDQDKESKP